MRALPRRAACESARPAAAARPRQQRRAAGTRASRRRAACRSLPRQLTVGEREHRVPLARPLRSPSSGARRSGRAAGGDRRSWVRAPAPVSPRRSRPRRGHAPAAPRPAAGGHAPAVGRARAAPPRSRALRFSGRRWNCDSPRPTITTSFAGSSLSQPLPGLQRAPILARARGQRRRAAGARPCSRRSGRGRDRRRRRPPRGDRAASAVRSAPPPAGNRRASGAPAPPASAVASCSLPSWSNRATTRRPTSTSRGAAASAARVATSAPSRSPWASRTRPSTSHSTGPGARSSSRASSGRVPRLRATANATRPDSAAALGIAWRQLANQSAEHGRDPLAVGGIAARDAQARRPQREVELRGGVPRAQPRLQLRSRGGGFAGPFQRVCQADRDLVALRLDARELAQELDGLVERALVGRVARAGQDGERGVDETAARGRSPFDLQRVVVRRQRGGVVAGCGKRAGTARERGPGLRSDPQSLLEGCGRRFRVTQRRQQLRVGRERRVRALAAARDGALGASAEPLPQARPAIAPGQVDESPRDVFVVGAFEQRPLGAFEQRARIRPMDLPVRAGGGHGTDRSEQGHDEHQAPHSKKIAPVRRRPTLGAPQRGQKNRPPSPHHCERRGPSEDFEKGRRDYEKRQPKRLT